MILEVKGATLVTTICFISVISDRLKIKLNKEKTKLNCKYLQNHNANNTTQDKLKRFCRIQSHEQVEKHNSKQTQLIEVDSNNLCAFTHQLVVVEIDLLGSACNSHAGVSNK